MKTFQVYLGFDPREEEAYRVARNSILKRCDQPIQIIPLNLKHLGDILTRPIEMRDGKMWCPISNAPMSTEFAISRFCVPFLQTEGWAVFADCDIICWEDISNLFALADPNYAVQVVKHKMAPKDVEKYELASAVSYHENPSTALKMDGQIQTFYNRKNWSSVVLWNCGHPAHKKLTKERLNNWAGRDLHGFQWLDGLEIGELPQKWNWLVNVTEGKPEREGIWHFTEGGAWFPNWTMTDADWAWLQEANTSDPLGAT